MAENIIWPENILRSRRCLMLRFFVVRFVASEKTTSFDEQHVPIEIIHEPSRCGILPHSTEERQNAASTDGAYE